LCLVNHAFESNSLGGARLVSVSVLAE